MPTKRTAEQNGTFNQAVAIYADATGITHAGARKLLEEEPQRLMYVVEGLRVINLSVDDSSPLADQLIELVPEEYRSIPLKVLHGATELPGSVSTADGDIEVTAPVVVKDAVIDPAEPIEASGV